MNSVKSGQGSARPEQPQHAQTSSSEKVEVRDYVKLIDDWMSELHDNATPSCESATSLNLSYQEIDGDGVWQVADALEANASLTTLDLMGSNIGNDGARYLADVLKTNTTLTELSLNWNTIGVDGAYCLADALKTNTTLITLNLDWNGICAGGTRYLADALKTNTTLTTLDLIGNNIGIDGAHHLADALRTNTSLTTLNLVGNNIGVDGARCLAATLETNTSLTTLDLGGNNIGIDGAHCLTNALKINVALTTLYLGSNNIGVDGAHCLADALKTNITLTTLYLNGNNIGIDGARYLADALKTNITLTTLYLDRNNIGVDGAHCLADALKTNITLTTLYLNGNNIGIDGARYLADALKTNTALSTLYLDWNNIGINGAHHLAGALRTNTALTTLYINENNIDAEGARYLADTLKTNAVLAKLYLGGNNIGIDGARYLADALKTNTVLVELGLKDNDIGDDGARALADSFKENAVLTGIDLIGNNIKEAGCQALAEGLMQQYNTLKVLVLTSVSTHQFNSGRSGLPAVDPLKHIPSNILQGGIKALLKYLKELTSKISRRRIKLTVVGTESNGKTPILDTIMTIRISCIATYCLHDMACVVELKGFCLTLYKDNNPSRMTVLTNEWTKELIGNMLILAPPATANEPKIVLKLLPSVDTTVFLSHIDHLLHEQPRHDAGVRRFSIKDIKGDNIGISAWNFAGQEGYHGFLRRFIRDQALCLIVWDVTKQSSDDASNDLLFWLRSLHSHLPSPTGSTTDRIAIIIVGTHLELLPFDERDPASAGRKLRDKFVHDTAAKAGLTQLHEIIEISSEAPLFLGHDQLRDLVSSAAGRLAGDGKFIPDSCIAIELLIDETATTKQNEGELPIISVSDLCNRTLFPDKVVKSALEILDNWSRVIYQPDVSDLIVLDPSFSIPQIMDELLRPFQ